MSPVFDVVTARLIVALARDGSIGRTAERENIAPSAISRRLAELEARLALPLFERTTQGVHTTPAGDVYVEACGQILRDVADLETRMRAMARGHAGFLRIGATSSALSGRLPELLSAYLKAHPGVAVELNEWGAPATIAALEDARIDIAIVADNYDLSRFSSEIFENDRVWVVAPGDHPLAATLDPRHPVEFASLDTHEVVGVRENGALDRLLGDAAKALGRQLGKRIKAETFSSLVRLVEAGFGIGFLRATSLHLLAGTDLKAAPHADAWADRSLMIAWRPTSQPNTPLEAFRNLSRQSYLPQRPATA